MLHDTDAQCHMLAFCLGRLPVLCSHNGPWRLIALKVMALGDELGLVFFKDRNTVQRISESLAMAVP